MYHFHEKDDRWKSYHYDYTTSPYLDPTEIERIKHNIDPRQWASEYMATFEGSGNNVFYCFDRKTHVRKDLEPFHEEEDVHVAIDFNTGIQATSAFAIRAGQMHFLDELQGYPDTETLAVALRNKYVDHRIISYPDPTGKSRKTSSPVGRTDLSILESYGITVRAKSKSPPIVDSVNAVNRKLMTASGDTSLFISPNCSNLIHSLERTKWVNKDPNTATIDKSENIEHFSDGVRYAVDFLFPIMNIGKRVVRGIKF
jgi:hypothetical protein